MIYWTGMIKSVSVNGENADFERNDDFLIIKVGKNGGDVLIRI